MQSKLEPVFTLQPIKSKKGIRTIEIERPFNRGYLLSLRSGSSTRWLSLRYAYKLVAERRASLLADDARSIISFQTMAAISWSMHRCRIKVCQLRERMASEPGGLDADGKRGMER